MIRQAEWWCPGGPACPPSNLAASSCELNMPLTKAVLRCTLKGVPTSFSFFTTLRQVK